MQVVSIISTKGGVGKTTSHIAPMGVPWSLLPEGETTMALAVLNLASQARFSPGQAVMTAGVNELV